MLVRKLTPRERRFCRAMLSTGDPLKAAEAAGYANHNAGRALVKRPAVKAELLRLEERLETRRDAQAIASAEQVQARLSDLMFFAKDEKVQLGAAQALAKIHGLMRERIEHTGADGGAIVVAPMSRREALERLAELARTNRELAPLAESIETVGEEVPNE